MKSQGIQTEKPWQCSSIKSTTHSLQQRALHRAERCSTSKAEARERGAREARSRRRSQVPIEIVLSFPFRGPRFEGSKLYGPHLFRKYTHSPSWALLVSFSSFWGFDLEAKLWRQTQRGEENALLLLISCCCHNSFVMTHPWPLPLTPKPLLLPSLKPPK